MTFQEIYTEITKRAGQGYGNFADRAQSAFWKGVLGLIQAGEYSTEDIRGMARRSENESYLASEFPYDMSNQTSITDDHVFTMQVDLRPGFPENIHYTRLDERILHRGEYLKPLAAAGIKEVYYALKYPVIDLKFNTGDSVLATAWAYVTITWTGIDRSYVETTTMNAQDAQEYMSQGFMSRAIEAAVQILTPET